MSGAFGVCCHRTVPLRQWWQRIRFTDAGSGGRRVRAGCESRSAGRVAAGGRDPRRFAELRRAGCSGPCWSPAPLPGRGVLCWRTWGRESSWYLCHTVAGRRLVRADTRDKHARLPERRRGTSDDRTEEDGASGCHFRGTDSLDLRGAACRGRVRRPRDRAARRNRHRRRTSGRSGPEPAPGRRRRINSSRSNPWVRDGSASATGSLPGLLCCQSVPRSHHDAGYGANPAFHPSGAGPCQREAATGSTKACALSGA